jgi:hypothetical protein
MSETVLTRWLMKPPVMATAKPAPAAPPIIKRPRSLSPLLKRLSPMDDVPTTKKKSSDAAGVVLGVLGTDSKTSYEEMERDILAPLVEAWGLPDSILLPAEGESSQVLKLWAQSHDIPVRFLVCDWAKQGRGAAVKRNAHIQREATHLLLLQGPRSMAMTKLAARLHRKGCPVVLRERPGQTVRTVQESVCPK